MRYATRATDVGACGPACDGSPQVRATAEANAAAKAVILSAATVARAQEAVVRVAAQVSKIETIARKARTVGRIPPKKAVKPADPTLTPAEELHRFELPDTGFDQDVFGPQQ